MKVNHEKPWYTSALVAFFATDVPDVLGISPSAFALDIKLLERRTAAEGESFLTKTLPSFGKAIDLALQGHRPLEVLGFKKISNRSALPSFLKALTVRVFQHDGWLRANPCITSIRLLRQACFWCKKVEKGFTDESLQQAIDDFIEVDRSLPPGDVIRRQRVPWVARAVIQNIFAQGPDVKRLRPKHGPGAVAWNSGVSAKREMARRYTDLESVFRPIPFFFALRDVKEDPQRCLGRWQCKHGLSRTTFVEKDSSGPRTIGLEPAEYQWCQQSLKDALYHYIENHRLTKGQINFTDQSINQRLTAHWAEFDTLDMSKASDRNSYDLVKFLFQGTRIWPYLRASRTPGTVLPNGQILMFKKFAPMGSAVCFPVEALVFFAMAVAVLHLSGYPILIACKNVFVYGDDLIVPHGFFAALDEAFSAVGLKFNENKCCTHGKFRESCGMDAYDGIDITPVRMRKIYPTQDPTSLIPIIKHVNRLYEMGYRAASFSLREEALRRFPFLKRMRLPTSNRRDLPVLAWAGESSSVKTFVRNGLTFTRGWVSRPQVERGTRRGEVSYLRESLSRGGPVGRFITVGKEVVRVFDVPYRSSLSRRTVVLTPEFSGEQPPWVDNFYRLPKS